MLKKIAISILLVLTVSNIASAEPSNNIAVVNTDKIRMETKAGKSIADQLMSLQKKFQDKVAKLQKDFDAKKAELDKQKAVLSKEAFAKKETEFNNKFNDARTQMQQEASNMEQMQQVALNEFNVVAMEVVTAVAKEGKYMQIFPAELLVYVDSKSDITSQVIAGIDKKINTIALKDLESVAAPAKK